jgi:large subunit ribosomal protein L35
MPKQKTHKSTKKRFRLSANGKPKHRAAGTSHLAARKTHKRKRMLRAPAIVEGADAVRIQRALCSSGF